MELASLSFVAHEERRLERGSILLTSNQSFGEWGEVLGDAVIAAGILDRLSHHNHVINIRGGSPFNRRYLKSTQVDESMIGLVWHPSQPVR
jgi:DNA replication protein DnaC